MKLRRAPGKRCACYCAGMKITGPLNIRQNGGTQVKPLGRVYYSFVGGFGVVLLFVLGTNESATFPTPAVNVSKSVTHSWAPPQCPFPSWSQSHVGGVRAPTLQLCVSQRVKCDMASTPAQRLSRETNVHAHSKADISRQCNRRLFHTCKLKFV